jgi:hypothetical protein
MGGDVEVLQGLSILLRLLRLEALLPANKRGIVRQDAR